MGSELTPLVAAQLSAAAYSASGPGTDPITGDQDWTELEQEYGGTEQNPDTTTQFVVYVNQNTKQIVFAFRGSTLDQYGANFRSDLANAGATAWESIKANATAALKAVQNNPIYAGYTIITDGHSLGGGMAQTMALENNLSGYGQNSLPVSGGAVAADNITYALWQNWSKTYSFSETNLAGDPATFYYTGLGSVFSGGAFYLNGSATTTTIVNPYLQSELIGIAIGLAVPVLGIAIAGWSAYQSHSISTVVSLLSAGASATTQISLTSEQTASAISDASTISSVTVNPDGSSTITETNGTTFKVATTTNATPPTSLTSLASGETYVFDPGTTNTAYTITGIPGVSASAIAYDPNDGGTLTFNQDTTPGLELPDGTVLNVPGGGDMQLVGDTGGTATPEQTLLDYLSDIGDSLTTTQLETVNYAFLNPAPTSTYTVIGAVYKTSNTTADVIYSVGSTPGAIATGQSTVTITDYDANGNAYLEQAQATNVVETTGAADISHDTITNIPILDVDGGSVTLTQGQFAGFTSIDGGTTLIAATGGTFDLSKYPTAYIYEFIADDWTGTTLIGNNYAGQKLVASEFGNDTLQAGNGGGELVAGGGTDTLIGGSGGDFFIAGSGNASLQGNGGNNTYDIAVGGSETVTINNFHTDNGQSVIDFLNATSTDVVASQSGNNLVLTVGADPVIVQNYFLGSSYKVASINFADGVSWTPQNIPLSAICYLAGTHILTPTGEGLVEDLKIGDLVVTRFSGIQPIKWIGRQSYDSRFTRHNRDHIPVCVHAGALADHMPARDLYVSPGHSMLVGEQLVLAWSLVNGITITQDSCPAKIEYFQIELDNHDCVIAEGAWSETFADGPGLRQQFHNAAEFAELYPDQPIASELSLCAPRPDHGPKLDAALRPVVARTTATLTPGPLRGYIDRIEAPWAIDGWAQDTDHPELPVLLEVLLGDRVIATTLACDHRQDLQDAGIGQGRNAFFLTSPIRLRPEMLPTLRVRRVSDHAEIPMTPECRAKIEAMQQMQEAPGLRRVA